MSSEEGVDELIATAMDMDFDPSNTNAEIELYDKDFAMMMDDGADLPPQDQPQQQQYSDNQQQPLQTQPIAGAVVDGTSSAQMGQGLVGRPAVCLYLSCNPDVLSDYQCQIRKEIELFEAIQCDVESNAKGRNKPIVLGQVGIRCRHCNTIPPSQRARGAMYYPTTLEGIYQAAQILANGHLLEKCPYVPKDLRQELVRLKQLKSYANAGKEYWAETASALGVYESPTNEMHSCLRFTPRIGMKNAHQTFYP